MKDSTFGTTLILDRFRSVVHEHADARIESEAQQLQGNQAEGLRPDRSMDWHKTVAGVATRSLRVRH